MFREEMEKYFDQWGLITPYRVEIPTGVETDNGIMFTSEYYQILIKLKQNDFIDEIASEFKVEQCISNGVLFRHPLSISQEGPDDYYALFSLVSAFKHYDYKIKDIMTTWRKNWGFLSNSGSKRNSDGSINWEAFLIRQPQLYFAGLCASDEYRWYKPWQWPVMLFSSGIIATSCMGNKDLKDADSRRLAWHLIQATQNKSFLCKLASKLWFRRLYKQYGVKENGMREVAKQYYQTIPEHPFIRYFMD